MLKLPIDSATIMGTLSPIAKPGTCMDTVVSPFVSGPAFQSLFV